MLASVSIVNNKTRTNLRLLSTVNDIKAATNTPETSAIALFESALVMEHFPPNFYSSLPPYTHIGPGPLPINIEPINMATTAQNPAENQIRFITEQLRTALTTHQGRAHIPADRQFLQQVNSLLAQAPALLTSFNGHWPYLQPAARSEGKFRGYIAKLTRLSIAIVARSAWPLGKLERGLRSHGYRYSHIFRDDQRIRRRLEGAIARYMSEYTDRGLYDRWEEDYHGANYSDCWIASRDVISIMWAFCDAVHEVCLRAMRIYGREKGSTRRFSDE